MKAQTLSSIFLNFSILSYKFLNIHLYRAFGSKLPHTFFYSVAQHFSFKRRRAEYQIFCYAACHRNMILRFQISLAIRGNVGSQW
jgi:hypothetical protein